MSTVWIAPVATILVPTLVVCFTALQISRTLTRTWSVTFTNMARDLDEAAQTQPPEPRPPAPTPRTRGRHGAQPSRRPR
ncbi:hypothetical protein [Streptomyces canus]|uniref:hypothetical protein n=1 Tax=Streptomyces canus TaxID=58343 RepID=UPI0022546378|nr:hypothetical protein [Streptomyces canus]MCX4853698.1 hypothetical protein [Streptomyces canus]